MLVLSREHGESVKVGHDVTITIVSISEGLVRIGIAAPPHVVVHREEIYLEIKQANEDAATSASSAKMRDGAPAVDGIAAPSG